MKLPYRFPHTFFIKCFVNFIDLLNTLQLLLIISQNVSTLIIYSVIHILAITTLKCADSLLSNFFFLFGKAMCAIKGSISSRGDL